MLRSQKNTKHVRLVIACSIWLLISSSTITIYSAYPLNSDIQAPKTESEPQVRLNELIRTSHVSEESDGHPLTKDETMILRLDELVIAKPDGQLYGLKNALHSVPFMNHIDQPGSGRISPLASITSGVFYEQRWNEKNYQLNEMIAAVSRDTSILEYYNSFQLEPEEYIDFPDPQINPCSQFGTVYGPIWEIDYSDITAGDFDGDGFDEIAFVFSKVSHGVCGELGVFEYNSALDLYIFDFQDFYEAAKQEDFTYQYGVYSWSFNITGSETELLSEPKIRAGELDGDGKDEIILTIGGSKLEGWMFEKVNNTITGYEEVSFYHWDSERDFYLPPDPRVNDLVLSDIDGDHLDEILFIMKEDDASKEGNSIYIKDDKVHNLEKIDILNVHDILTYPGTQLGYANIECGDIDGDGINEIIVFSLNPNKIFGTILDDYSTDFQMMKYWSNAEARNFAAKEITLGDFDADGLDEIVFSTGDGLFGDHIYVGEQTAILDDFTHGCQLLHDGEYYRKGFIVAADLDANGVKLRYTGESWNTTAQPRVDMVIAAPPTYTDISQNYLDSATVFGELTSKGYAEGRTIGISEGTHWSVGAELEIDVEFFSSSMSFSYRNSLTRETMKTRSFMKTTTFTKGYDIGSSDDAVIYHITDFKNYQYQIISHPTDPTQIGQNITIDIPLSTALWKTTRTYFNEEFSSISPTIGTETFNHTVGQPWTYPNGSMVEIIAPNRWASTNMQTVGQGVGHQTTSIELEEITSSEMSLTESRELSYEFQAKIGGGVGVKGYATAGLGWTSASIDTMSTTLSVGESCVYEGNVGDIEDVEEWENLKFEFALFVYNLERPDVRLKYQVINYIVEGADVYTGEVRPTTTSTPPGVFEFVSLGYFNLILGTLIIISIIGFKKRRR